MLRPTNSLAKENPTLGASLQSLVQYVHTSQPLHITTSLFSYRIFRGIPVWTIPPGSSCAFSAPNPVWIPASGAIMKATDVVNVFLVGKPYESSLISRVHTHNRASVIASIILSAAVIASSSDVYFENETRIVLCACSSVRPIAFKT